MSFQSICEKRGEINDVLHDKWCKSCLINYLKKNFTNWTSRNEKLDNFIQEMQLKIDEENDIVFEWIPYNQFNDIKEIDKEDFATIYSAIWKDGPLYYNNYEKKWIRKSDKRVVLKCSCNSQNVINEFLNEVKTYSTNHYIVENLIIFGISQNPDTKNYIMILQDDYCENCGKKFTSDEWCHPCQINYFKENFINWTSGNEKLDNFIQEMQLFVNSANDVVFEWIPYDQLNNIKEIGKEDFATVHLAIWKVGPLHYNYNGKKWIRICNKKVALKCLYNSQNITDEFLNEVKAYSTTQVISLHSNKLFTIYGISQNPDTKDYIIVLQNKYCDNCGKNCEKYLDLSNVWCKPCQINYIRKNLTNWASGNEKIDDFIQEMQSCINSQYDKIFEWIPYNQFNDIKEIGKSDSTTIYLARWKDGPFHYDYIDKNEFMRESNKKVALKCLNNSRNIADEFLNQVKVYSASIYNKDNIINNIDEVDDIDDTNDTEFLEIYGISQNPITKDYIIVLQDGYCEECGKEYTDKGNEWCKPCQINYLKKIFTNWASGNEKIDNFIQGMQLSIDNIYDRVLEWTPYNQFNDIKEIGKNIFTAIWKDGPLYYDNGKKEFLRNSNENVALKCLDNSQNTIDEFLNEVIRIHNKDDNDNTNFLEIYGISQNPNTKDYIMILQNGYCKECGEQYVNIEDKWCKPCTINYLKWNFTNWTSGNEKLDHFIKGKQLKMNEWYDIIFEWIPYDQFDDLKKIGVGGFATVYSATWKDGRLDYDYDKKEWTRNSGETVALKCLHNLRNITDEFLNEVKAYSNSIVISSILEIYGISQNPDSKNYIIVLQHAKGGNFNDWMKKNYANFSWRSKIRTLSHIIEGLEDIHQGQMVHRDFHPGNILFRFHQKDEDNLGNVCISDMGLCGEIGNTDKTKVYGVMPYVAPEVLHGKPYTTAADIYSFGMIMYFVATGRKPFADHAFDENLALNIFNGIRPEISELEIPNCYSDLMNKCWNSNPANRPNASEIKESIILFEASCSQQYEFQEQPYYEIEKQFREAEKYRRLHLSSFETSRQSSNYPQAQLLNPYTKNLPKYDNEFNEFSDNIAVENLFLQHVNDGEFSDSIAVEEALLQHLLQSD